jgi:hypothetical protein
MLISHSKEFIFIHIYKTAGESVREVFLPYARLIDRIVYHYVFKKQRAAKLLRAIGWADDGYKQFTGYYKHSTASQIRDKLGTARFDQYYKFAFVRNPFDWLISLYYYIKQSKGLEYNKLIEDLDFKAFVKWYIAKGGLKQTDFLVDSHQGTFIVDYIGRFENLHADIVKINKALSLPPSFHLSHINPSVLRAHRNYDKYYDRHTRALVEGYFSKDFQRLGYSSKGFDKYFCIGSSPTKAEGNPLAAYTGMNTCRSKGVLANIEEMGWTLIAFVNPTNSDVTVTLSACKDNGRALETTEMVLIAHEKRMGYSPTFFSQDISTATFISYTATAPVVAFQLNIASDQLMLDGLHALGTPSSTLYFLHIESDGHRETEIGIVNTDPTEDLTGVLAAYSDQGEQVSILLQIVIKSQGRRKIIIGEELPSPEKISYLVFEGSPNSAVGYTRLYASGKYRVALPAVSIINSGDILVPHLACDNKWWTKISIINTTAAKKNMALKFNTGHRYNLTLKPAECRTFAIQEIFGGQPQPDIQSAVIKNGHGVIGLALFGSDNLLSGILLTDETATNLYYPHVAPDMSWWTGIVGYNPSDVACTLNFTAYSANGNVLRTQSIVVDPGQKYVSTASQMDLPVNTGWVHVTAETPISGFELFEHNNLYL